MVVLSGVVPVFLIMGLGALGRRLGWIDDRFVGQLNQVIYYLAIPALLVALLRHTSFGAPELGPLVVVTCGATLVVALAAGVVVLITREVAARAGVVVQAAIRGNIAYVAFPVILGAGGEPALRLAALTAAVLIPFQNLLSMAALAACRGGGLGTFLRTLLLNPVVLGVAGGLTWAWSGWGGWEWLNRFLDILGDLAMPGALLALGGQLRPDRLRTDLQAAATSSVLKLIFVPAAGLVALRLLGADPSVVLVGVLLLAAPTAVASTAVAQGMGGDVELAGAAVMASSLASFPAFVLWGLLVS